MASPGSAALVRLVRPRQWIKNVLVFAAPAAAGVLDEGEFLGRTLVMVLAFCLAASGTYCLNDAADAEADRQHPTKRDRPVASGEVAEGTARLLGVGLVAAGLVAAALTGDWQSVALVAVYVALTTSYTLWLKHLAVVDIVVVASGFVLRAVAGAVGTDIPVSDWYLIVASFGSLFLVAGKRSTEMRLADAATHRRALAEYSTSFLVYLRSVASGVTLLAYCLWAFEKADLADTSFPFFQLSVVPFALVILRYALILERGDDRNPEEIVLGDRELQVMGALWALVFALGVYLGDTPPVTT